MAQAPGPKGREILAVVLGRRRDPIRLIAALHDQFGDMVHIPVGSTSQFLLGNLEAVKHVLIDQHRNYSKGPAYELLSSILGNGLVTSEGEHWKNQRKLIQPIFQKARLRIFSQIIVELVQEEVHALEVLADRGGSVDIFSRMMALALKIVSRTVLGTDVQAHEQKIHDAITVILHYIEKLSTSKLRFLELLPGGSRLRGLRKWLSRFPSGERKHFLSAIEVLNGVIGEVLAQRRAEMDKANTAKSTVDSAPSDLVTMLLQTRDEFGQLAMSDTAIRDEVMTFFLAGHETTATALTWTFYLLAKHPDYQQKMITEIKTVLQDRAPCLDDLAALPMCQWVFEESLRLYPPVWRLSRFARENDVIQGYAVSPGSVIVVTPYLMHRDPRFWENPTTFEPERFCPERSATRQRLAYLPFGAGPRVCLGASFAMIEAQMILALICRRILFTLVPDHQLVLEPRVLLRPRGGMPMSVQRVK